MKHIRKMPIIPWQAPGICFYLSIDKVQTKENKEANGKMPLKKYPQTLYLGLTKFK